MMRICSTILLLLFQFVCSPYVYGEPYKYESEGIIYEVAETASQYVVLVISNSNINHSRNQNIVDRKLRFKAIDVIGTYILYKEYVASQNIRGDCFQLFADGANLHYNATITSLQQEFVKASNGYAIRYLCNKWNYDINNATYTEEVDLYSLLIQNYQRERNEQAANLLCEYNRTIAENYIAIERDFLSGNALLPMGVRELQSQQERLNASLLTDMDRMSNTSISQIQTTLPKTNPYLNLCYIELVSSVPLKQKTKFYDMWHAEIESADNVWYQILSFCSGLCRTRAYSEMSISGTITAFTGAISPHALRKTTYEPYYEAATQLYANSQFDDAITLLTESIDINGISPQTLNLLGASYRLSDKPKLAMPYLLLCFRWEPHTPYLVGNIALCLQTLNFPNIEQAQKLLSAFANDIWSKEQLRTITN